MPEAKCGFADPPVGTQGARGRDMLVLFGPTLPVDIGFDPNFKADGTVIPVSGMTGLIALVDTGALESCIDGLLAAQLGLPVVDRRSIAGVGGVHEVNMHLAQIRVPSLDAHLYGTFATVDLAAGGQPHKALIGRTFLQNYTMVYEGSTGNVTLSRP